MKIRKQTRLWKTRDGRKLRICDMEDDHLENTLRFLKRIAHLRRSREISMAYRFASILQGEMAIDTMDRELDYLEDHTDWEDFIPPIYWNMCEDFERRTGKVWKHE